MQKRSINLLSPELRNQIAAGEVVERPASVLKELVENSLDAQASQISIQLENGGQGYLKVQDNGLGIAAHELELAVTRHATSKIHDLNDLLSIHSYGFRGEALPSIASVSRFCITSALSHSNSQTDLAHCLQVEFGQIISNTPAALPRGTIIEVRDLFANIPARLKFLKNPSTENKKAQEWLTRLAIAKTNVGFTLNIGGREVLSLPPEQSLAKRLGELWPPLIMEAMRNFDHSYNDIRTHGMAALPHTSQPRANRMLFYVNGRAIQDKTISAAVREAYKGCLTTKDFPQVVLFIEINPEEIDVNVHPAKTEIRFRDTSNIFSAVRRGIQSMLEVNKNHSFDTLYGDTQHNAQNTTSYDNTPRPQGFWGRLDDDSIMGQKKISMPQDKEAQALIVPEHEQILYSSARDSGLYEESANYDICLNSNTTHENYTPTSQTFNESATYANLHNSQQGQSFTQVPNTTTTNIGTIQIGSMQYLGQIDNTYLILKSGNDTLLLLDQHAMHERILFARMQADALAGTGQLLALPLELHLHVSEIERAVSLRSSLEKLGFDLEINQQILNVRALPPILERTEAKNFLREALAGTKDDLDMLFISFACKASIKARQKLTIDEAIELIHQWLNTAQREYCPHGRPCVLEFSAHELEKMFKRK